MAKVKLTLSVDKNIVETAKIKAIQTKTSLSNLVENYLKKLTDQNSNTLPISDAQLLRGIAKNSLLAQKSYKELRAMHFKDKYGI